jgi:lysophospholipase L1-like esterase
MSTSSNSKGKRRSSRWKGLLKNLAFSAAVFLLCLAVVEVVLRFNGYGNLEVYQPDPKLYWRLKPNQECFTKVDHKPVHVNSLGTRGREFSPQKPPDTIRILSLGDSKTFGWGMSDGETYSAILEKSLQRTNSSKKVEVINGGVNAWSYPQIASFFQQYAHEWKPDIVIIGDANPWTQFPEEPDAEFLKKFLWRVRLKNFLRRFALFHYVVEAKLQKVYEHQRRRFVPVDAKQDTLFKEQQQKDPDALFRESIDKICAFALTNGIQPVLIFIPFQDAMTATNTTMDGALRAKRQVSAKYQVPFHDFMEDLRPQAKDLYLEGDTVHLTGAGNEIIGRRLAEIVSSLLKQ